MTWIILRFLYGLRLHALLFIYSMFTYSVYIYFPTRYRYKIKHKPPCMWKFLFSDLDSFSDYFRSFDDWISVTVAQVEILQTSYNMESYSFRNLSSSAGMLKLSHQEAKLVFNTYKKRVICLVATTAEGLDGVRWWRDVKYLRSHWWKWNWPVCMLRKGVGLEHCINKSCNWSAALLMSFYSAFDDSAECGEGHVDLLLLLVVSIINVILFNEDTRQNTSELSLNLHRETLQISCSHSTSVNFVGSLTHLQWKCVSVGMVFYPIAPGL